MIDPTTHAPTFPTPLDAYPAASPDGLLATLSARVAADPFNAVATAIFLLAIVHTFGAPKFAALAHRVQHDHDARSLAAGTRPRPSVRAEILHFLGEIEVVFGLWAAVLLVAVTLAEGWEPAKHYFAEGVNYTEPLFVIVIRALAATRPIITFAEGALRRVAGLGGGLTVIANAPNPAGQALVGRFFGGAISPFGLLLGALIPTLVAVIAFRLL